MRIGVISDTHGLLRPEVFDVFGQVDHILHGGDVGPESILDDLQAIAGTVVDPAYLYVRHEDAPTAPPTATRLRELLG